jgi:hypothetical protein
MTDEPLDPTEPEPDAPEAPEPEVEAVEPEDDEAVEPETPDVPVAPNPALLNEDWLRSMSWDVRLPDGALAATLTEVAYALAVDRAEAARRILSQPFGKAAPDEIRTEAQAVADAAAAGAEDPEPDPFALDTAEPEPVDDEAEPAEPEPDAEPEPMETPDVGDEVEIEGKSARIDLIVSGGTIPGIDDDTPVTAVTARLAFADGTKAALPLAALARPAAAPSHRDLTTSDLLAARPDGAALARKVSTVYMRGIAAAPPDVASHDWAIGRVLAFLGKVDGKGIEGYIRDDDLLPEGHPQRAHAVTEHPRG